MSRRSPKKTLGILAKQLSEKLRFVTVKLESPTPTFIFACLASCVTGNFKATCAMWGTT